MNLELEHLSSLFKASILSHKHKPVCRDSGSARRLVSVALSILAKAELVGANTVKGATRPVSVPGPMRGEY